jgi:hypothetical protein
VYYDESERKGGMIIVVTVKISWMMIMESNMTRIRMEIMVKNMYDFVMRVEMSWIMIMQMLRVMRRI